MTSKQKIKNKKINFAGENNPTAPHFRNKPSRSHA